MYAITAFDVAAKISTTVENLMHLEWSSMTV
jgi:hypothetical protein